MLTDWKPAPRERRLQDGDVHVWLADLSRPCDAVLSSDEAARAGRFVLAERRRHFSARRTVVRRLLGHYLGCDPRGITFVYGRYGKPELGAALDGAAPLRFNASHTTRWLLVAVTKDAAIGVDLEVVDARRDHDLLARACLSEHELAVYEATPAEGRSDLVIRAWARKEALLKAAASGLTHPLRQVEVDMGRSELGAPLTFDAPFGEASRWTLTGFEPTAGHHAAIAVARRGMTMSTFEYT